MTSIAPIEDFPEAWRTLYRDEKFVEVDENVQTRGFNAMMMDLLRRFRHLPNPSAVAKLKAVAIASDWAKSDAGLPECLVSLTEEPTQSEICDELHKMGIPFVRFVPHKQSSPFRKASSQEEGNPPTAQKRKSGGEDSSSNKNLPWTWPLPLNRASQILTIGVGTILFCLIGLFPPYEGKRTGSDGGAESVDLGHHFLLSPPSKKEAMAAIMDWDKAEVENYWDREYHRKWISVRILAEGVWIPLAVILVATLGSATILRLWLNDPKS